MNSWCESCARKNLCYVVDDRPKCFVPITNTASGTPYLVGISSISRDNHEIAKDEPQTNANQHVQHVESVKDETGRWVRVGQWEWEHHTDTTHFGKAKGESITTNKIEDEPQTHDLHTNTHECVSDTPQTDCPWK